MQHTRKTCALSFMPDMRLAYERILSEARDILHILDKRFLTFTQQQNMFVFALNRCRETNFEPNAVISSLSQVSHYAKNVSSDATDKRILKMFLVLIRDLGEFRRTLVKLTKQSDEKLETIFARWKRLLEPNQDISRVRVRFPNNQLNHLSVDECRNHFGGIVSVMPIAMECAREALRRIELTRVYRPAKSGGKCKERMALPKPKPPQPCMLQESEKRVAMPHQTCKRIRPPSPNISSPVSSISGTPQRIPSVESELTIDQVQDCKIHRLLRDTEQMQREATDFTKGRSGNRSAWESSQNPLLADQMNKCIWKNRTCSEEFIDKMISDKQKRDHKYLKCKH